VRARWWRRLLLWEALAGLAVLAERLDEGRWRLMVPFTLGFIAWLIGELWVWVHTQNGEGP